MNPDAYGSELRGYQHPIIYDVLPFENDTTIKGGLPRNSKWRGYLNTDTVKVTKDFGTDNGIKNEEMKRMLIFG